MAKRKVYKALGIAVFCMAFVLSCAGCQENVEKTNAKTTIEIVSYKQEAVGYFENLEKQFNETHEDIELKISSPNDAITVLKTRFIREDNPDIIAIGGDYNFSNLLTQIY